ncbi:trifunctional serine/threonine-protein kinase/ATP-binding protein/sensor histidine kinase [Chondromyces crocatus]|uniref:histidine kinase n=1 Tax=Chondromyces crocatus TaxID=52 RepID=A0A0K1ECT9_CHOCO|nr:ATP-binding sensor histidine kinase [Chondromyces crocatus]AKT38393.1 ATPase [Chondromyces crocatus]
MEICGCDVLERVREGSRTTTYRARRRSDGLAVLLKVLREPTPSQAQLATLRHEETILGELDIDGVLRCHGIVEEGGRAALLLEDFTGSPLDALGVAGSLPIARVVTLAIDVVGILEAIHQRGVVHRDLTPATIAMRSGDETIKFIDFGLASLLPEHGSTFTSPGGLQGSLAYMAPEQTGRMNRPIDYRADYYSLGVTLFELLTGHLPFTSGDGIELVHAHIARQPPSPRLSTPEVPEVLAAIVLKLMAKSAEGRYQSAQGIRADLARCLEQLQKDGDIAPFSIARRDRPTTFKLPQKLYGRDADVQTLLTAFEHSLRGVVLMLVSGPSGIGKTSLIREVYRPITVRRGYFIAGKFDQYRHEDPHAALKQALRELSDQLLAESEEHVLEFQKRARDTLGSHARILTELCPSLARLLGEHPEMPTLSHPENLYRFNRAVTGFLASVATPEHPLCVFFDDLQWANADALKLLEHLSRVEQDLALLIIGAHRDEEILDAQALALALRAIEARGARVERVCLSPLGLPELKEMVADTLSIPREAGEPLAELLLSRTAGNPFFVREFFTSLHADGAIEAHDDGYRWSVDRMRAHGVTDNLVDLMTARLRQLCPETRELLLFAACLGSVFELGTLALVSGRSIDEVSHTSWPAVIEGLIFLVPQSASVAQMIEVGPLLKGRFAHDRIQQATLSMVGAKARARLARTIGRQLAQAEGSEGQSHRLLDIVGLLNEGRIAIDDRHELLDLAALNLRAARKARDNAAAQQALSYGRAGILLIEEGDWSDHYELTRDLYMTALEAAIACGDIEAARELSEVARPRLQGLLDEVRQLSLDGQVLFSQQRVTEALRTYLAALARLGCELPQDPTPEEVEREIQRNLRSLKAHSVEELEGLSECRNPVDCTAMFLLSQIISSSGTGGASVYPIAVCQLVAMSLRCGVGRHTSFGYALFGSLLLARNEIDEACRLGHVALRIADRSANCEFRSQTYYVAGYHLVHVERHLRDLAEMLSNTHRFALEAGSLFFSAAAAQGLCLARFLSGEDLSPLLADMEGYARLCERLQQPMVCDWLRLYIQVSLNLIGKTGDLTMLRGPAYVEAERVPHQRATGDAGGMSHYHFCKMLLHYLFGEHDHAAASADTLASYPVGSEHSLAATFIAFIQSLSYLALYERAENGDRERKLGFVAQSLVKIEQWCKHHPPNYEHKLLLISAERARVLGDHEAARAAFTRGTELADRSGYRHEAAIGHELAGRFYILRGEHKLARKHLRDAHEGFLRWGAVTKARQLEREYPGVVPLVAAGMSSGSTATETGGRELDFDVLDLVSVLNASQDLSREIELDRLLARLMQILLETSGATVGYLLMEQGKKWVIEGEKAVTQENAIVLKSIPVAELMARGHRGLPASIIHYVARSQESLVVDDASADPRFSGDPCTIRNAIGSVLCFPLGRPGGRRGLVYLENSLLKGAFTPARIRILQMLSTQAVISIENAALYNTLEQRVESRTSELRKKNEELATALTHLRETQDRMFVQERLASLGSLAAGIAHELRNPLNFVNNFARFAAALVDEIHDGLLPSGRVSSAGRFARLDEALEDLKVNVTKIGEHGRRMDGIIRSMLDHSRDDRGARQWVDLNTLVETYVNIGYQGSRARTSTGEIAIEMTLDPSIGLVSIVPQEVSRVIINLVDNACYAVTQRAGECPLGFEPRIEVITRNEEDCCEIRIRDNGSGVPRDIRARIFDPFFTTKPPGEGTGLGLSICHTIVTEGNGGLLRCESEEGIFAEFIVRLPK